MADAKIRHQLRLLEFEVSRTISRPEKFEPIKFESAVTRSDIIEQILFWAFVVGLAWVPFWYGSNQPTAWGINAVLFPSLTLIYEISLLTRGLPHPVAIKTIRVSVILFIAVVTWIFIQNATWTPSFLHHPIWGMASDALQTTVDGSISVNRDATTVALLRLLTGASTLWLAIQLCRNESRAIHFLTAFLAISFGYAAYGLIQFAFLQLANSLSRNYLFSTFINHNHYATYAGMGLITAFGLIARKYERELVTAGGSLRFKIASFIDATGQTLFLIGGGFLILVAVILTESRGGVIATGLGVTVWGALTFGQSRRASIERRMIMFFGGVIIMGVFAAFGDIFIGKLAEAGLSDSNRISVYAITLRSILDAPLLGYGYGTFADIFPMFRDKSIDIQGVWKQAHNTYFEVFQGLGLIFGSMLVASIILLVLRCCKGAMEREQITVPCIATGIAVLVGVHALVDFSIQIQAVSLSFMAILGAGVAQSVSSQTAISD